MRILIALLLLLSACASPTKVVTTYETDSVTGKTKKIVTKYYDTVRVIRERYYDSSPNIWFHNYWDSYWWWNSPVYRQRYYYVPRRSIQPPPPPIKRIPSPRN